MVKRFEVFTADTDLLQAYQTVQRKHGPNSRIGDAYLCNGNLWLQVL